MELSMTANHATLSPDSKMLIVSCQDGLVIVYSIPELQVMAKLPLHEPASGPSTTLPWGTSGPTGGAMGAHMASDHTVITAGADSMIHVVELGLIPAGSKQQQPLRQRKLTQYLAKRLSQTFLSTQPVALAPTAMASVGYVHQGTEIFNIPTKVEVPTWKDARYSGAMMMPTCCSIACGKSLNQPA